MFLPVDRGDLLAVNWIGRDDNSSTGLTGASGAARVWSTFMADAAQRPLAYRVPDGIEHYWIDEESGKDWVETPTAREGQFEFEAICDRPELP